MKKQTPNSTPTTDLRRIKGQATKERLLIEAIRLFGQKGFEGTNTRMLAEAAQCNLGLITFHFGSKLGLYNAAIDRVKYRLSEIMSPTVQTFEYNLSLAMPASELFGRTKQALIDFMDSLLGMEEISGHALLLLRDSQEKKNIDNGSYQEVFLPILDALERSLDKATNYDNPTKARLTSFFIFNATFGFLGDFPRFYNHANPTERQPDMKDLADIVCNHILGNYI